MTCTSGNSMQLAIKRGAGDISFANDTGGTRYLLEVTSESIEKNETQIDLTGIRGTRTRRVEGIQEGPYTVGGEIVLKPSPGILDILLPYMLGADESTNVFATAETLPEFACLIDRVATIATRGTFKYQSLKVGKWTLRGAKSQAVELALQVMGKVEDADSDAFPSLSLGTGLANTPYIFEECTLVYNSVSIPFSSFEISCDNVIEDRRENSLTSEDLCPTDRIVMARFDTPWQNTTAPTYDIAPAAGTFTLQKTGGPQSTIIAFGRLVQPAKAPTIRSKGRIPWNLSLEARSTGSTPEIQITNDPSS